MRISDLAVPAKLVEVLQAAGYDELYPSQEQAAPLACEGRSLVMAVPTASGKSLVAYLALLRAALAKTRGIYIVPLRALATEKHRELLELAGPLGLKVALATGELDRPDPALKDFDVLVCTSEKADSLLRQGARWVDNIGCIVADEVHLLHDPGRGPTLEVLLARFRHLLPDAQVLALSATIENSADLAAWLDAEHVTSDWRPVELREGVLYGRAITFADNTQREVPERRDPLEALAEDTLSEGGQVMVFVNTRRSAEATATRLAGAVGAHLPNGSAAVLQAAAQTASSGAPDPVRDKLLGAVRRGCAFHHAGLTSDLRRLIERLFLDGHLRLLTATPTLAAGLNLPARRVIIRDLFRFDAELGRTPIPVLEYKQMAGRAGRPRFDPYGEAITLAKTNDEREEIQFRYLLAGPEAIESKLAQPWALRTHLLATIAAGYATTEQGVHEFIDETFYAHQSERWTIDERVERTLDLLVTEGFLDETKGLRATRLGQLTAQLYIDPASTVVLRDALSASPDEPTALQLLHAVCATPDMRPFYLRRADAWIEERAIDVEHDVLAPYHGRASFDQFLAEIKTALVLEAWTEEATDEELYSRYGAYPGDIRARVDAARWLLHAARRLCPLFAPALDKTVARLSLRVRHGVREELLPLLEIRGIGRYRARQLFAAGYTTTAALRDAAASDLVRIKGMGPGLVERVKRQLGAETGAIGAIEEDDEVFEGQLELGHFPPGGG